ncbi:hypothetical protein THRCLA_11903 [Thraustotheca clavata]|uniref:Enhancer of polycomb-like protein n=1 Tax=Thraustotheca clavata TaxID=74557 RepID=A0A1V9Y5G6_9STRA|nr:hypothetical protein THRCLA_11903 [Thraustotheca clavata]
MHRRQSLRPRALDIHSRIRIIRSDEDIVVEEEDGGAPAITSLQELTEMIDDQPAKPKRKKHIPIPVNSLVPDYEKEVAPDYVLPTSYIKMSLNFQSQGAIPASSNTPEKVEVDLEAEDMQWLKSHPKYGELGDPRYQLSYEQFAKMLDVLEKATALINPGVITLAEADELFLIQLQLKSNPLNRVTTDVYNYWVTKRQQLKRPLLRKYWPQTPLNDTNPHLVFRPREKERYKLRKHRKNDMEGLRKLQQLRNDFERVRHLLEMVKRRERFKRMMVDFLDETRRQSVHDVLASAIPSLPPRHPKIPTEEDRENKHKKKKKKKDKKHRRDSVDEHTSPGSYLLKSASTLEVQRLPVLTFLEKQQDENKDVDEIPPADVGAVVSFPSYPPSGAHMFANIRSRIGRGGRLIMDRVPIYKSYSEFEAPPLLTSLPTSTTPTPTHVIVPNIPPQSTSQLSSLGTTRRQRLEAICSMSDSEDELVTMDTIEEDKVRQLKYTLAIRFTNDIYALVPINMKNDIELLMALYRTLESDVTAFFISQGTIIETLLNSLCTRVTQLEQVHIVQSTSVAKDADFTALEMRVTSLEEVVHTLAKDLQLVHHDAHSSKVNELHAQERELANLPEKAMTNCVEKITMGVTSTEFEALAQELQRLQNACINLNSTAPSIEATKISIGSAASDLAAITSPTDYNGLNRSSMIARLRNSLIAVSKNIEMYCENDQDDDTLQQPEEWQKTLSRCSSKELHDHEKLLENQLAACPRQEDVMQHLENLQHKIAHETNSTSQATAALEELREKFQTLPTNDMVQNLQQTLQSKADKVDIARLQRDQYDQSMLGLSKMPLKCLSCDQYLPRPKYQIESWKATPESPRSTVNLRPLDKRESAKAPKHTPLVHRNINLKQNYVSTSSIEYINNTVVKLEKHRPVSALARGTSVTPTQFKMEMPTIPSAPSLVQKPQSDFQKYSFYYLGQDNN